MRATNIFAAKYYRRAPAIKSPVFLARLW